MRADGSRCVTVPLRWRISNILSILPAHFFSAPNLKVFALLFFKDVAISVTRILSPTSKHDNVRSRNIQRMSISSFWRQTRNSQSWPDKSISIKNPNIIKVRALNMRALIQSTVFKLCLSQFKPTMYHKIISDQNRGMTLSWCWGWPWCFWSLPGHNLQIQNVNIVEIMFAVPATKHIHFRSSYDISRMVKPSWWGTGSTRSLIPSHRHWIESMQVFKWLIFATFTSKHDDSWSS